MTGTSVHWVITCWPWPRVGSAGCVPCVAVSLRAFAVTAACLRSHVGASVEQHHANALKCEPPSYGQANYTCSGRSGRSLAWTHHRLPTRRACLPADTFVRRTPFTRQHTFTAAQCDCCTTAGGRCSAQTSAALPTAPAPTTTQSTVSSSLSPWPPWSAAVLQCLTPCAAPSHALR
jgi:hypothetical protein